MTKQMTVPQNKLYVKIVDALTRSGDREFRLRGGWLRFASTGPMVFCRGERVAFAGLVRIGALELVGDLGAQGEDGAYRIAPRASSDGTTDRRLRDKVLAALTIQPQTCSAIAVAAYGRGTTIREEDAIRRALRDHVASGAAARSVDGTVVEYALPSRERGEKGGISPVAPPVVVDDKLSKEETTMTDAETSVNLNFKEYVKGRIALSISGEADALATFQQRFGQSPSYAFEWSLSAFRSAAKLEVLGQALREVETIPNGNSEDARTARREWVRTWIGNLLSAAENPKRSTSPADALLDQERTAARATVVRIVMDFGVERAFS